MEYNPFAKDYWPTSLALSQGLASCDRSPKLNEICTQWLTVPDDAFQEELIHAFLQETLTKSLKWNTCASSTEKVTTHNSTMIQDMELDLKPLTHPDRCPEATQDIWLSPDICPPHMAAFVQNWSHALLNGGGVITSEDGMCHQLCLCDLPSISF